MSVEFHLLRQAIEAIPPDPEGKGWTWVGRWRHQRARAEAWKAAFWWRDSFSSRMQDAQEYSEGRRLIQEKLK